MRFAVVPAFLGICLLASHTASAAPRLSGNRTIVPLAANAPTVTVNAGAHDTAPTSREISTRPAYGADTPAVIAVANGSAPTTTEYYEGEGCDADIFDTSSNDEGSDNSGGGDSTSDPSPSTKGDDDDDDKNKPATEPTKGGDDDEKTDAGTDTKTLNVTPKLHAMATPRRSSSPVSRVAIAGVIIVLPLRRRGKRRTG